MLGHGYEPVVDFVLLILQYSIFHWFSLFLDFTLIHFWCHLMSLKRTFSSLLLLNPPDSSWLHFTLWKFIQAEAFSAFTPPLSSLKFPTQLNTSWLNSTLAPSIILLFISIDPPYLLTPLNSFWLLMQDSQKMDTYIQKDRKTWAPHRVASQLKITWYNRKFAEKMSEKCCTKKL